MINKIADFIVKVTNLDNFRFLLGTISFNIFINQEHLLKSTTILNFYCLKFNFNQIL
jgi:hypothetical protein